MNTEKKLRGRPHKKEEDKLIGRRVSMELDYWNIIDDFLANKEFDLADLLRFISIAIYKANNVEGLHEN
jgi:hypothetical protein